LLTESQDVGLNLHPPRHTWDEEEEEHRNRFRASALWIAVLLVAAALGGAAWYFYPVLEQQGALPAQLAGVKDTLATAGKRIDATDQRLSALIRAWDAATDQVTKLESKVNSNLQTARKQTQELVVQMQQRVQAELDKRVHGLETRVVRVEAGQESDQVRVAKLEKELASVREEYRQQLVRLEQERDRVVNRVDQQLTGLDQRVEGDTRDLAAVHTQIDRKRVDFEAGLNHSREVAPGITLQVNHTDVSYQRFDGWVFLMPDRRTVWVHSQNAQRPLVFYSKEDGRSREVVITRVTKYSVVGYVLVPENQG